MSTTSVVKVKDEEVTFMKKKEQIITDKRCKCVCWKKWLHACTRLNSFFEEAFTLLGYFVYNHRKVVVVLGVIVPLLLATGFVRFFTVTRVEELYIPQNSQALRDLKRAHQLFGMKVKVEEFIIKKKHSDWALTRDVFTAALQLHGNIVRIEGLDEICLNNAHGSCLYQTPLELFEYNSSNFDRINQTLNDAYNTPSLLLSNGASAALSFPSFFARFKYERAVVNAEAIKCTYFVRFPETGDQHMVNLQWEKKYVDYLAKEVERLEEMGLILLYTAGRSLDDSVSESSMGDIKLVSISLLLMALFCSLTLAKCRNPVVGHFWLGNGGLLTLTLGIGAAFGLVMLTGQPYIAFVGVLPFLVLGVGIDNMFIILDCLDRQEPELKSAQRIAKTMGHVGATITMTTLTDLVAFAVSMVTDFPAIKYFCLYAALSISICYILVITLFLALLAYDVRRIEAGRRDIFPQLKWRHTEESVWVASKISISAQGMRLFAMFLMKPMIKYPVFVFSIVLLMLSVVGSLRIDQSFDMLHLGLKGSSYVKFYSYRNKAYPAGFDISIVIDTPVNYTDSEVQRNYVALSDVAHGNKHMERGSINWMTAYKEWALVNNRSLIGRPFYKHLYLFLAGNRQYLRDVKMRNGRIIASRVWLFSGDNENSIFRKDMMLSLREDIKRNSPLPAYPIHLMFIYIEQFVIILRDTIRNLVICSLAILLITLPYLKQPLITFFVFFGFVSLIFELLALMYIWNVSLNSISMTIIVMAIGFAVDYAAHVAHAYMISKADTPEQRAIDAISTMGSSVLMGGASTFVGVIITAFASSEIFKIFFKMVFGIVTLGLLHGLVFLPVLLSMFCRTDLRSHEQKKDLSIPLKDSQCEGDQGQDIL